MCPGFFVLFLKTHFLYANDCAKAGTYNIQGISLIPAYFLFQIT